MASAAKRQVGGVAMTQDHQPPLPHPAQGRHLPRNAGKEKSKLPLNLREIGHFRNRLADAV
jgi:hypothetical protein